MKNKQTLLKEAQILKNKLTQVENQIRLLDVKRMQTLAGFIKENEKFDNPDASHVISDEENELLSNYFLDTQDEQIPNVSGKTAKEAANIIGPKGYEEETLQHILVTLFPDKYEGYY